MMNLMSCPFLSRFERSHAGDKDGGNLVRLVEEGTQEGVLLVALAATYATGSIGVLLCPRVYMAQRNARVHGVSPRINT